MQLIQKYFPGLTPEQYVRFEKLGDLYRYWNERINLVSRKDIENLYERHILHSLAIAKYTQFAPRTTVLDLGTGGGFPGIPLAILFPDVYFHLIDGTLKKIKVVKNVIQALGLKNAIAEQIRAEDHDQTYDFVISRAVAQIDKLVGWCNPLIHFDQRNIMPNGLIALKGGNIQAEVKKLSKKSYHEIVPVGDFFEEAFFKEKYIVYVQR